MAFKSLLAAKDQEGFFASHPEISEILTNVREAYGEEVYRKVKEFSFKTVLLFSPRAWGWTGSQHV